jgi:large subunit ribosomal protein L4
MVLEDFTMEKARTKEYASILKNLNLENQKVLFVIPENNANIFLSSRNIQKNKVIAAMDLNTYDVLNAAKLVLVEGSLSVIEKNLSK